MPKKRRKLNRDMEKEIATIKKQVELITAMINDIEDESLQVEYRQGFEQAHVTSIYLSNEYDSQGFTEETQAALFLYNELIKKFESEYEI